MRVFAVAADVVMGLILGLFLYLVLSKTWATLQHPAVAVIVFAASVMVVLFRRPNGSLATRRNGRANR